MTTAIFTHPVFGRHAPPEGHIEQPARYRVVDDVLGRIAEGAVHFEAPLADINAANAAHDPSYVDLVADRAPDPLSGDVISLDPDTFLGAHSLEAALRGVGGAMAAVDAVVRGDASNAFVAARPPGHHAVQGQAMGFCVFNNVALGALWARQAHGLRRVAVVDFDVHHGNGTQDILESDPDAFFASSHEWPQYPGTGWREERGDYSQIHNAPLTPGDGSMAFQRAWAEQLLPALDAFEPDIIMISAGFDGHEADPLGGLNLTEGDFSWVTSEILKIARARCEGRVVSVLEGGYHLDALAASVATHVKTLANGDEAR